MDFYINGLSTENRLRSKRTTTQYKITVNNSKSIDLIRIELTRAILMPTILKVSEEFEHQFSQVFILGNMFPEIHGFVAMPVTSCIKDTCSNLSLYLISEGRQNCSTL